MDKMLSIGRKFVGPAGITGLLATASNSVSAGIASGGSITLGPASVTAVPALTPAMMIGLGILLAVIAVRVLRKSGFAQRVASLLLIGGAGVVGGLGVERTIATHVLNTSDAVGGDCDSATIVVEYQGRVDGRFDSNLTNSCSIDLEILDYDLLCSDGASFNDNGSPVGTIVAEGEQVPVAYCELPQLG